MATQHGFEPQRGARARRPRGTVTGWFEVGLGGRGRSTSLQAVSKAAGSGPISVKQLSVRLSPEEYTRAPRLVIGRRRCMSSMLAQKTDPTGWGSEPECVSHLATTRC